LDAWRFFEHLVYVHACLAWACRLERNTSCAFSLPSSPFIATHLFPNSKETLACASMKIKTVDLPPVEGTMCDFFVHIIDTAPHLRKNTSVTTASRNYNEDQSIEVKELHDVV